MANGASGVIAGRSLWKDCVSFDRAEQKKSLLTNKAVPLLREDSGHSGALPTKTLNSRSTPDYVESLCNRI